MIKSVLHNTSCFHCGDECQKDNLVSFDDKSFCCSGCKTVFQILNKNNLCDYYSFNEVAGVKRIENSNVQKFAFLDNPDLSARLIVFSNQQQTAVNFYLPQMHCSSCLWLLENLHKLDGGIVFSTVNFPDKQVTVYFNPAILSVRQVAELLSSIGYEPHISLDTNNTKQKEQHFIARKATIKIGIAGFCFANIMLLSFPEYLGLDTLAKDGLSATVFRWLNLFLSLPVLLYSGSEFFVNAWYGFKQKILNIDAPIALALAVTFTRSIYEIISVVGGGYLDSMSGIIFFMLVGRAFQTKTFANLKFNRDYTSYFPIAVCKIDQEKEESYLSVSEIKIDDTIRIRNQEVIPVDGILIKGQANIDYSFVTGENETSLVKMGEIIYAGGKQTNGSIDLLVVQPFSQSNFTRLWNHDAFKKENKQRYTFTGIISNYFAAAVFFVALTAFVYWYNISSVNAWNALTAVLIVACPCALLLTTTFTQGFILNIFSNKGLYLKNANILQIIPSINHIVFDKTGTLTKANQSTVQYEGKRLSDNDLAVFAAMFAQSLHPLSRSIAKYLKASDYSLTNVKEQLGLGIEAWENDTHYKLGSSIFQGIDSEKNNASAVWVSINNQVYGKFEVINQLRDHVDQLINQLPYSVSILSGDNDRAAGYLISKFTKKVQCFFNQTPQDKLTYIANLQQQSSTVMMVGDGLNDAGALQKSNIGIAVVDNTIQFSPASDAILLADKLPYLNDYIKAAISAKNLIKLTFVVSLLYNVIGLYFSVTAQLSPLVAAVLMPMSTLSIVLTTMLGSFYIEKKHFNHT
ncbi:MAG: HAD family hydrolase [Sphingobacteriia bacterium]|nr:MAG: HAD family hydrolase [Sphingobacteriia bacterium]